MFDSAVWHAGTSPGREQEGESTRARRLDIKTSSIHIQSASSVALTTIPGHQLWPLPRFSYPRTKHPPPGHLIKTTGSLFATTAQSPQNGQAKPLLPSKSANNKPASSRPTTTDHHHHHTHVRPFTPLLKSDSSCSLTPFFFSFDSDFRQRAPVRRHLLFHPAPRSVSALSITPSHILSFSRRH